MNIRKLIAAVLAALLIVSSLTFCTPLIVPDRIGQKAVIKITNMEQLLKVGSRASV